MIEVEVRGKIKDFEKTLEEFRSKAKFIQEKKRISFVYFRHEVCKDVRKIKSEKVDLKARITNGKAEIVLKYGNWRGSDSRREISLPIEAGNFEEALDFLKCLDWSKGVIVTTDTFVFDYKGIEFAIVKNKYFNYFEAEKLTGERKDIDKINKEISEACEEFNLKPFTDDEFFDQLNTLNHIEKNQFDFTKQNLSYFEEKFKEYF